MQEQRLYDIDLIFISYQPQKGYEIEFRSRHNQVQTFVFTHLEGIEIKSLRPFEVRSSFLQLSDQSTRSWNVRLDFPVNIKLYELGSLIIEVQ